jgi:hypothetical protein
MCRKNQLGLSPRLAAINLRRMVNLGLDNEGKWLSDPSSPERASPGRQKWDLTSGTTHPGVAGSTPLPRRRFGSDISRTF